VTLNDLEWRNDPFMTISRKLTALQAYYLTLIEDRPILTAEYHLPLIAKTNAPCSAVSLR